MTTSSPKRSEGAAAALKAFRASEGDAHAPIVYEAVAALADHAPSLAQLVRGRPLHVVEALSRPVSHPSSVATFTAELDTQLGPTLVTDGPELRAVMRRFRHRSVLRIALREILRVADVAQTSREMADLATVLVRTALRGARAAEAQRFGTCSVPLVVLGMGKLGGGELNLGSDIDLVMFYATDEGTVASDQEVTVHELYARIVRRACASLAEVTDDGFCFRVDLRLRPEGSRGPLVNSLASAERYYEAWGRTWERAALVRAAPIAGDLAFGHELLTALRPFIYRRAVAPELALEMREMLARSRRELGIDSEQDLKLGRGGIREAEFFVQTLQLIWGGRHPELRVAGTLEALSRLEGAGLVTAREVEALTKAWSFLRRAEHRVHMWSGYQTHQLPTGSADRLRFARSLGFETYEELATHLDRARTQVTSLSQSLLPESDDGQGNLLYDYVGDMVSEGTAPEVLAPVLAKALPVRDPFVAASHVARLGRRANAPLGPVTWQRLPALGRTLLSEVASTADPDTALRLLADFSERLGDHWPYERSLMGQPRLTRRLIGLFGASETLSSALVGHPEDIDLLMRSNAPTASEISAAHQALTRQLADDSDPEWLVGELRRLKRTFTLQIGLAWVANELDLATATDRLSELAERQIEVSLEAAERWATRRWGRPSSQMVVCALGKLGGRELGFDSDLDLIFLYGVDGETTATGNQKSTTHAELFTRVAQRTMMLLRQRDAEGHGYETDTRLRPSGSKGTLVVSLAAFDRYHQHGGKAWERQALIRARTVAGDQEVGREASARFTRLTYGLSPPEAEDLVHLRGRMQAELSGETRHRYHPKLGYGGLWDIEWLVQWLQMKHGTDQTLRTASTANAIGALERAGLLAPAEAETLREASLFLRTVEQSLRLFESHRSSLLEPQGRTGLHVARALGLQERDGLDRHAVLDRTYRAHTRRVRHLFERLLGCEVAEPPPWEGL